MSRCRRCLPWTRPADGIDAGRVIYCGTFSKTVVPGLRIGWIVAPRPVIEKLVLIKQASDLHTSALNQMAMLAVARGDRAPTTRRRIRAAYRERRDAMLAALEASHAGRRDLEPACGRACSCG